MDEERAQKRQAWERQLDQWEERANDIEWDMSDWERAVTAYREEEAERELLRADDGAPEEDNTVHARWMRALKRVENWVGTLFIVTMGAGAVNAFRKGDLIAGLFNVLFLVAFVAMWQVGKRLLQRGFDQTLVPSLPQNIRVCRVDQVGEELVFRDLGTQELLLPLQMGDISYLADPALMPQYRNRSGDYGEHTG